MASSKNKLVVFLLAALGMLVLPLILQYFGNAWVRIADLALLYIMLALGLNIVVGFLACWTWAISPSTPWAPTPLPC